jgi:NitT/TauT family transport system permease protein
MFISFGPYVAVFYAALRVVFIPVIVVWLGIGELARTVVVFLAAVFPIILNLMSGVRSIDSAYLETAKSFMLNERQMVSKIVLPGSLAFMISRDSHRNRQSNDRRIEG